MSAKADFQKWIIKFRTEGWDDDWKDAQLLIGRAEKVLFYRTNLRNGVWHLFKESFDENSIKLAPVHWIYDHFETFTEIDRENELIRTFDFGYD